MKQLKKDLQAVSKGLKGLAVKTEKLMKRVEGLEKAQANPKKGAAKKPVGKKAAVKNHAKEGKSVTATDKVVAIIQKAKEGIDVSTLISSSGLEDKQIRNILNRALNLGKIKRASRGVYIVA